jgi:hypothetical protein
VQSIHLVQGADHLAPWLAFVGALLVATIAAVTAQARLRAQLYAEDKRHRDQLSFQRAETDRAELRQILDALAEHMHGIRDAARGVVSMGEEVLEEEGTEEQDYWQKRLDEYAKQLANEGDAAARQIQRLRLRLGSEGSSLILSAEVARGYAQSVQWALTLRSVPPDLQAAKDARDKLNSQADRFFAAALKLTSASLHQELVPLERHGAAWKFFLSSVLSRKP